ncbi:MAG: hypothetical protein RIQ62_265 [Bacteroidota bacterium]
MKKILAYTLQLFLFWLILFFCLRVFFVAYQWPIGQRIAHSSDILHSFWAGYQLDIATAVILLGLPMILSLLYYTFPQDKIRSWTQRLVLCLLLLYAAAAVADAGLYREWNAKINMQALDHFKNPSEVFKTLSPRLLFLFVLFLSLFSFPFFTLYKRYIHPRIDSNEQISRQKRMLIAGIYFILSIPIAVILIRGGITNIPINQSAAYFSADVLANDIAVNPLYNLLQDATIKNNIPESSTYTFFSSREAQQNIADDFTTIEDTSLSILQNQRPNLVFIFLESWSVDNVGCLGGIADCTPHFDSLSREGILFTRAYANAYVSDQGIPAVLSAYPSASRMAVINQPSKVHSMPCISEDLAQVGYSSSFLFGGDLVYGNIRGYLLEKKFGEILEQNHFPQYPKGSLGIHDEFMFPELLKSISTQKPPFLQGFFTMSTHMPYDYTPVDSWHSTDTDPEKAYTESVHYSDRQLGAFFDRAKHEAWYANTLFVVVADHSHNTLKQWNPYTPMHSHIPFLLVGGALKREWQGKRWDKVVSQLDIAHTLLAQMGLPAHRYPLSRNLFNPNTASSAYYVFFGGAGYLHDTTYASAYIAQPNRINSNTSDTLLMRRYFQKAFSFQQGVYEDVKNR